ncbi:MAG TPA: DEAD/DEAH box helicase, partial [Chloroflexota bacterium]|nr:DEAD/DEAH box helicase [Chloroflexota bacterium]
MTQRKSPRSLARQAQPKRSEAKVVDAPANWVESAASREFLEIPPLASAPLIADPAQEEARQAIRLADTIFIAPTGYGKSWVAYAAAGDALEAAGRVYYTTPLKALSNQKFVDLSERFGPERVGLITGDRRENPSAAIVVLTTEILRAMLLAGDALAPADSPCLIVLDEWHWLADPERGTTWEEVILLAPRSARLLLLSASVGNGDQIAEWLEEVRGHQPRLLMVETRAVPQRWGVWHNGTILPLGEAIARNVASGLSPAWPAVVEVLKRDGLTPALVFLPTRRACDALANQC